MILEKCGQRMNNEDINLVPLRVDLYLIMFFLAIVIIALKLYIYL